MKLNKFKIKVGLCLVTLTIFLISLTNAIFFMRSESAQKQYLRSYLITIAKMGALLIDADEHSGIPLNYQATKTEGYLKIQKQLQQIRDLNPNIRFVYTMIKSPNEGKTLFVVDADHPTKEDIKKGLASFPGDEYDASRYPEMLHAFIEPSVDKRVVTDEYGSALSGYAPIKNESGETVAILGIDMHAKELNAILDKMRKGVLASIFSGIIFAIILISLFTQRITKPINKLIDAIRYITKSQDLKHVIKIKTGDEIEELANAFNQLTHTLGQSNKQQKELFLDVIQSLGLALEANNPYEKGHSQRVTDYAQMLAKKLNLKEDEIHIIKEMGLLHDIGKIGISKKILEKPTSLTDEEWQEIRKHPLIGEKILAPLALLAPELSLIRSHHERYNGEGYPDGLKGGAISDMVSIIAVCDAFDAMTSSRPYRINALSKEQAIQELQSCSGTQFNPKIVDAFIALYKNNLI